MPSYDKGAASLGGVRLGEWMVREKGICSVTRSASACLAGALERTFCFETVVVCMDRLRLTMRQR